MKKQSVPTHVAIIMDGNGRWANARGLSRTEGHIKGVDALKEVVESAVEQGVKYLTFFAFSTENWSRPKTEIDTLMNLLVTNISKSSDSFVKEKIQFHFIGDISKLPENAQKSVEGLKKRTEKFSKLTVLFALNYGSRNEILNATKKVHEYLLANNLSEDAINESLFSQFLYTKDIPDPDLLIRTSGELRISNFLLWQLAYSELFFTKKLWPDFSKEDFVQAITDYSQRTRRFGSI